MWSHENFHNEIPSCLSRPSCLCIEIFGPLQKNVNAVEFLSVRFLCIRLQLRLNFVNFDVSLLQFIFKTWTLHTKKTNTITENSKFEQHIVDRQYKGFKWKINGIRPIEWNSQSKHTNKNNNQMKRIVSLHVIRSIFNICPAAKLNNTSIGAYFTLLSDNMYNIYIFFILFYFMRDFK